MEKEEKEKKVEPRSLWSFPRMRHPFFLFENFEDDWDVHEFSNLSGLSVYEDEDHVYVEAALPGILPEEIEMIYDKGVMWIKAEKKEPEDKKKKYYRKAMRSFSYRIAVPGDIDESKDPEAICKNGVLKATFFKTKKGPSTKKILIKEG